MARREDGGGSGVTTRGAGAASAAALRCEGSRRPGWAVPPSPAAPRRAVLSPPPGLDLSLRRNGSAGTSAGERLPSLQFPFFPSPPSPRSFSAPDRDVLGEGERGCPRGQRGAAGRGAGPSEPLPAPFLGPGAALLGPRFAPFFPPRGQRLQPRYVLVLAR